MTRQEIEANIKSLIGEDLGSPGADDPFMLTYWVNHVTDEMARATDCYYTDRQAEVVENQSVYCAPDIYRVKAVHWFDTDSKAVKLIEATPAEMDAYMRGWRDDTAGSPQYYVVRGSNQVVLYPTPDTSSTLYAYADLVIGSTTTQVTSAARPFSSSDVGRKLVITDGDGFVTGIRKVISVSGVTATLDISAGTAASSGGTATLTYGGLLIEGYGVPGDTWSTPASDCPLPGGDPVHMGVVFGSASLRMLQLPDPRPADVARMQVFDVRYQGIKGKLEAHTATLTQATGHGNLTARLRNVT